MRIVLALVAVVFAAMLALAAAPAVSAKPMACSAGGDWNPVTESDVIVGGRITAWERRDDLVFPHPLMFTPVELHMEIADVWKGQVRPGEPIIDAASLLEPSLADAQWSGSGGACGALNEDPTGMYAVFGLSRTEQGYLRTNLLTTFWLDDRPYDPAILSASERGFFRLPALGHGAGGGESRPIGGAIASMIVGVAGMAAVVAGRRSSRDRATVCRVTACGGAAATVCRGRSAREMLRFAQHDGVSFARWRRGERVLCMQCERDASRSLSMTAFRSRGGAAASVCCACSAREMLRVRSA